MYRDSLLARYAVITQGVWNSRERIPTCDSGAPDIMITPMAPQAQNGREERSHSALYQQDVVLQTQDWIRQITSVSETRYLTVPRGWC